MSSIAQKAQAKIFDLIASKLGALLAAELDLPIAGTLMTGLMNQLWPQSGADIWGAIQADVQALVNQDLTVLIENQINDDLSALNTQMTTYLQKIRTGAQSEKLNEYNLTLSAFQGAYPHFQQSGYEGALLPQFCQMVNLYLSLVQDGYLHGASWGMTADDVLAERNRLKTILSDSLQYGLQHWTAGLPVPPDPDDPNFPNQYNGMPEIMYRFAPVSKFFREIQLTVTDFLFSWPNFDPDGDTYPVSQQWPLDGFTTWGGNQRMSREIFSDSYWTYPSSIYNWGSTEGLLTSITGWGDTNPIGVQLGYPDGEKGFEGDNSTSPTTQKTIPSGDPVVDAQFTVQKPEVWWNFPTFDKQVVLTQRSGSQILLGTSTAPVQPDFHGMDLTLQSSTPTDYSFDDHVVSSVQLRWWGGSPEGNGDYDQSMLCNVVVGFRRWDSYADQQSGWRWCKNCQGLFFSAPGSPSLCKDDKPHVSDGSASYVLFISGTPPESQTGWYWCDKCGGIFLPSRDAQFCAGGRLHNNSNSGDYAMLLPVIQGDGMPVPRLCDTQGSWSQCSKCCLLFFSGNQPTSWCPADKGHHDIESELGHSEYFVKYND